MFNPTITQVFKAHPSQLKPLPTTAHQDSIPRGPIAERQHQLELKSEDPHISTVARMRDESTANLYQIKEVSMAMARANPNSTNVKKYEEDAYCASRELHDRAAPKRKSSALFHPIFKGDSLNEPAENGQHNPYNRAGMSGAEFHKQMASIHGLSASFAVGVKKSAHEAAQQAHQYALDFPSAENSIAANIASANRLAT